MPTVIIETDTGQRRRYVVHDKQAAMVEEVCKPPYNQLLEIGVAWANMQLSVKGEQVTSKIELAVK